MKQDPTKRQDDLPATLELDVALKRQAEIDLKIDAEDDEEGYSLHKDIIKEAWLRMRPVYEKGSNYKVDKVKTVGDLKKVFSKEFINFFISKMNLKIYSF